MQICVRGHVGCSTWALISNENGVSTRTNFDHYHHQRVYTPLALKWVKWPSLHGVPRLLGKGTSLLSPAAWCLDFCALTTNGGPRRKPRCQSDGCCGGWGVAKAEFSLTAVTLTWPRRTCHCLRENEPIIQRTCTEGAKRQLRRGSMIKGLWLVTPAGAVALSIASNHFARVAWRSV